MTRIQYDLLRADRPDLGLIPWISMGSAWRQSIEHWQRDDFITQATAHFLTHGTPYFGIQQQINGTLRWEPRYP